jgi:DNA-directed RNA polymerase I, II, and III subunit RPABC2
VLQLKKSEPENPSFSEETSSKVLIGPPKLTRFERAKIIGARALQLSIGAPLLIKPPKGVTSSIDLAIAELRAGVLPLTVRRSLPNGEYQDIPIQWLQIE